MLEVLPSSETIATSTDHPQQNTCNFDIHLQNSEPILDLVAQPVHQLSDGPGDSVSQTVEAHVQNLQYVN